MRFVPWSKGWDDRAKSRNGLGRQSRRVKGHATDTPGFVITAHTALLALTACGNFDLDMRSANQRVFNCRCRAPAKRGPSKRRMRAGSLPTRITKLSSRAGAIRCKNRGRASGPEPGRIGAPQYALTPDTTALRAGEILALPRKLDETSGIAVTTLAETAIDRADGGAEAPAPATPTDGPQPTRHRVERGETAFQIARLYNVSPRALADWNGLSPEMEVREGQVLMIPVAAQLDREPAVEPVTQPGSGSPTPPPPSASTPMPEPAAPAEIAEQEAQDARPPSPQLAEERTGKAAATKPVLPCR